MNKMQKYAFVLLCLSMLACTKGEESICSGATDTRTAVNLGQLYLDPEFGKWIDPDQKIVVFRNSNGERISFEVLKSFRTKGNWLLRSIPYKKQCYNHYLDESYDTEYDEVKYFGASVPFSISLFRTIAVNSVADFRKYNDSNVTAPQEVRMRLGDNYFDFLVSDTVSSYAGNYKLLDSLYLDVCVCINYSKGSGTYPTKFILQKGRGLIGFELSNSEVWARM